MYSSLRTALLQQTKSCILICILVTRLDVAGGLVRSAEKGEIKHVKLP